MGFTFLKIFRGRFKSYVVDIARIDAVFVELKSPQIVGEYDNSLFGKQAQTLIYKQWMISLNIEGILHLLRIREGWWIKNNNVVL